MKYLDIDTMRRVSRELGEEAQNGKDGPMMSNRYATLAVAAALLYIGDVLREIASKTANKNT